MEEYVVKQMVIAFCAYLGQILVGCGLGWSAPAIPKLQDPKETPLPDVITDGQASWIGSLLYIGSILGPYISGYLSNKYGRKPCLFLGGFLTATSFALLAFSVNVAMIYAGRILTGLGTSIIFVTNLVYLGEIASTNLRGIVLTGCGIFSTCGTLIIYSIAPYVSYALASFIVLAITVFFISSLFLIPESPVYFVIKGNEDDAHLSLIALGRTDPNDIMKVLSAKQEKVPTALSSWKDLFELRNNRRALFITFFLSIFQQLSGVMVVILFATTIFDLAGSTIAPNVATIIIGVTQLTSSCVTPFLVERTGRKVLLLWSTGLCFLSLAVLGTYFFFDSLGFYVRVVGWLPLLTLIIFFLAYDMGFGIIPATFVGELFSSNARSTGATLTITLAWLFGFGVSTSFTYVLAAIGGHFTFWIFAGACALAFSFTLFFVPETKGKTLIEIQEMLANDWITLN